jgi:hypothetical protein
VPESQRGPVHLVAQEGLRMEGAGHVQAHVVFAVRRRETDVLDEVLRPPADIG